MILEINHINELPQAAKEFVNLISDRNVFVFYGAMGVGKTTFIKAICKELKVVDNVVSPTFSLINEYKTSDAQIIYHFDVYRINKIEQVYDFGYEDYFYSGRISLIEWPEKIESILPEEVIPIYITEEINGTRKIVITEEPQNN